MEKNISLGVYRTLRKIGITRDEITMDTRLKHNLFFDEQEWNCFLFLLESRFNFDFNKQQESRLHTVGNVVEVVEDICCKHKKMAVA